MIGETTDSLRTYLMDGTPERVQQRYARLKDLAKSGDFGGIDADVVVIDTETTGVSFRRDELTQIAAARMNNGTIKEWFVTFVNPGKPIPEDIAHLTNIHDEDVANAPTAQQALADLAAFVGDSYLVAHNANFDKTFCTKHEEGAALANNIWVDSLDLSRIALPRMRSHRLIDLVQAFDAPISTHRADADVEALCAIYQVLLAAISVMPENLVDEIAEMATPVEWPTVSIFQHFAAFNRAADTAEESLSFDLRRLRQTLVKQETLQRRIDAEDIAKNPEAQLEFPSEEEITAAFQPDGIAGRMYESFEARSEQVDMACAVGRAFANSRNVVIEAGTGVGKSVGYLLPAVLSAKRNNISIGVATKTNALLDQLVNRELPLLAESLGGLDYVSLKGFSHYICLRKLENILRTGPGTRTVGEDTLYQAPSLAAILSYVEQTDYDDIDGLKLDYRALPRYLVTTTSHDCLRRKCPFFGSRCFVHGARQRAEAADIVVTNQTLLFCDVAAEGGLLPPIRYWVVDEAHGAEAEARGAFSCEIDADALKRLANRVNSPEPSRNIFIRAERQIVGRVQTPEEQLHTLAAGNVEGASLADGQGETLFFALSAKARSAGARFAQAVDEFNERIHDLLHFDHQSGKNSYDLVDLWLNEEIRESPTFANLVSHGHVMYDAAEKLVTACQGLVGFMEEVEGAGAVQREIASAALECKDLLAAIEIILFDGPPTYAYAAHLVKKTASRTQHSESLEALRLNVGDCLNETLFAQTHSVVFTSATMTVADSFDNFNKALGLGTTEFSQTDTLQLDSSYDFDSNMTIYVASDIPEPNDKAYLEELQQLLIGIHRAQQGSVLSLFTNRREMEQCFDRVHTAVAADDLRIVCQKWGVSVKWLRDEFLRDEHLSLFALKSFWEGFDAPGSTLKAVVIPKLPFNKPTDPLSCERAVNDPQAWMHYVLPEAVLETKQAAGRLIRSATDTGSLVLADKRLITKGYGKTFLRSMPSKNIHILTCAEIVEALAAARNNEALAAARNGDAFAAEHDAEAPAAGHNAEVPEAEHNQSC